MIGKIMQIVVFGRLKVQKLSQKKQLLASNELEIAIIDRKITEKDGKLEVDSKKIVNFADGNYAKFTNYILGKGEG